MTTRTLLSIAIIAILPFGANAAYTYVETNTPARVANDGTVKRASNNAPYVTVEPTVADETHIATTAYVKGAYNDAIAAVNKVNETLNTKIDTDIQDLGGYVEGTAESIRGDISDLQSDINSKVSNEEFNGVISQIVTDLQDYARGQADDANAYTDSKGVVVYTTWDTNDETVVGVVAAY